jgi:hypothetical protein
MGQIDWRTTSQEMYQGDLLHFFREEMRGTVSFGLAGLCGFPYRQWSLFHWLHHSSFSLEVACMRSDFPSTFCLACCPFLLVSFLPYSSTLMTEVICSSKSRAVSKLHDIVPQKTVPFILTLMRTTNPHQWNVLFVVSYNFLWSSSSYKSMYVWHKI